MLKIRSSEVSDLQALMCFAMLPALNCPGYDSEPVLIVLVAGGKYSTGLSEGFCCPGSPGLCVSKVVDCGLSSFLAACNCCSQNETSRHTDVYLYELV